MQIHATPPAAEAVGRLWRPQPIADPLGTEIVVLMMHRSLGLLIRLSALPAVAILPLRFIRRPLWIPEIYLWSH